MCAILNKEFFVVCALCLAQIMQSYGAKDDATNSKYDYEILKLVEYTSLVQKREIVQRKGRCKEKY